MIKSYLTIALRTLQKHKGYAAINVAGLAVGLAVCLLIGLYVWDELGYDRFHEKADRLYRLATDARTSEGSDRRGTTNGWPLGRILEADYPEVEAVTYLRDWWNPSFRHDGAYQYQTVLHADAHFFRLFSFPLVQGNPETALREPYSLVLTEAMAQHYFGDERALGKTMVLNDSLTFTVTGVVALPRPSHLQFDVLISFASICALGRADCDTLFASGWGHMNVYNYVLLREGVNAKAFEAKIADLAMERNGEQLRAWGSTLTHRLDPLTDLYLRAEGGNRLGPASDIAYVYLLSAIALFILLLACINFINLATARSTKRAKEVGIRKMVGSSRGALVRQFLGESFLTCLLALVVAVGLLSLVFPYFNDLTGKAFTTSTVLVLGLVPLLLLIVLVVSLLAGAYPAFVLAGFRPIEILKGNYATGLQGARLRQTLVIFQFTLSCVLLVSTLVVFGQLRYMLSQDPGFAKEQVVVLDVREAPRLSVLRQAETIKHNLAAHASVQQVATSFTIPGRAGWPSQWAYPEGYADGQSVTVEYLPVDEAFVATFGLDIVAGRDFSTAFETDRARAVLINEAAVDVIGWGTPEEALGKGLSSFGSGKPEGVVVGVVKDYHQHGLQDKIGPIMMGINPGSTEFFSLRVTTDDLPATLAHLEATWSRFFPGYPFHYFFLDEDVARQYEAETRLTKIFVTFALLAIVIACLGLFGLAAFTAEQRTKEIGIRKTVGASVPSVTMLLSKDFFKLVSLALLAGLPLAYVAMERWLDTFAYRIDIPWWIFLLAGSLVLAIALLTVSYQAIKAALADPVKALRYE